MEPSLYSTSSTTMQLKRKMTLDLDPNGVIKKTKSSLHTPSELLQSPDLQLLTIGTPEIERLILQNQNLPTPNLSSNFFFPKSITEEQEVYVKGFSDALDRIKQQRQVPPAYTNVNVKYEPSLTSSSGSGDQDDNSLLSDIPESEDANSSCYEPSDSAFPTAPIDMENQEKVKLERKRQRNRIAASKCRRRKLEKISKLEDKVNQLKRENSDLSGVMNKLKDHVDHLKEQIRKHMDSGCTIMAAGSSGNASGQQNSSNANNGFA